MKKLLLVPLFMMSTALPISLPSVSLPDWRIFSSKKQPVDTVTKARIAVIKLADNVDIDETSYNLYRAAKDATINAIVLVVDSSGGSAGAFSVVHDLVKKIKSFKPVVALVKSRALSGGYLVASAADYIVAHSYSDIGSIGVIFKIDRFKNPKVNDNIEADLTVEIFTDSELKAIGDPFGKDLTDAHRDYIKSRMAVYSNQFRTTIAANRGVSMKDVQKWAEAKVFIAHEALELNLIDEIGTVFDLDKKIISLLSAKNPGVIYAQDVEFV